MTSMLLMENWPTTTLLNPSAAEHASSPPHTPDRRHMIIGDGSGRVQGAGGAREARESESEGEMNRG